MPSSCRPAFLLALAVATENMAVLRKRPTWRSGRRRTWASSGGCKRTDVSCSHTHVISFSVDIQLACHGYRLWLSLDRMSSETATRDLIVQRSRRFYARGAPPSWNAAPMRLDNLLLVSTM